MRDNIKYKFYIDDEEVFPLYKSSFGINYSHPDNSIMLEAQLTEDLIFIGPDYDIIMDSAKKLLEKRKFMIKYINEYGYESTFFKGRFCRADCEINLDDKKITLRPKEWAGYEELNAALDKEIDLIYDLHPKGLNAIVGLPDVIQVHQIGTDKLWSQYATQTTEQICAQSDVANWTPLVNDYGFQFNYWVKRVVIAGTGPMAGEYAGVIHIDDSHPVPYGTFFYGTLQKTGYRFYNETTGEWEIEHQPYYDTYGITFYMQIDQVPAGNMAILCMEFFNGQTQQILYRYFEDHQTLPASRECWSVACNRVYELASSGGGDSLNVISYDQVFYARKVTINKMLTGVRPIPDDDIVDKVYFKYAVPFSSPTVISFYNIVEEDDTNNPRPRDFGDCHGSVYGDSYYYITPDNNRRKPSPYYPIAQDEWGSYSIWFNTGTGDYGANAVSRNYHEIYPVYSVHNVIDLFCKKYLAEVVSDVYTYGLNKTGAIWNYIHLDRLFITPQSNIMAGPGSNPATRYKFNMRQIFDMLREVFGLYPVFKNFNESTGKFSLQFASYSSIGDALGGDETIDATDYLNTRNQRQWSNFQNTIKYDDVSEDANARGVKFVWGGLGEDSLPFNGRAFIYTDEDGNETNTSSDLTEINYGNFNPALTPLMTAPDLFSKDCLTIMYQPDDKHIFLAEDTTLVHNDTLNYTIDINVPAVGLWNDDLARAARINLLVYTQSTVVHNTRISGTISFIDEDDNVIYTYMQISPVFEINFAYYQGGNVNNREILISTRKIRMELTLTNTVVRSIYTSFYLSYDVNIDYYHSDTVPVFYNRLFGRQYKIVNGYLARYESGGVLGSIQRSYGTYKYYHLNTEYDQSVQVFYSQKYLKNQSIKFPCKPDLFNFADKAVFIKTEIGSGRIDKMTYTLPNSIVSAELKHPLDNDE